MEVLFNGAALFGGMIVMPLYFQLQRENGIVDTGLLLVAFSLGAAATFPVAGWLTDRYGGGLVATAETGTSRQRRDRGCRSVRFGHRLPSRASMCQSGRLARAVREWRLLVSRNG